MYVKAARVAAWNGGDVESRHWGIKWRETETGQRQRDEGGVMVNRDRGRSGWGDCSCVGDPYLMRERSGGGGGGGSHLTG